MSAVALKIRVAIQTHVKAYYSAPRPRLLFGDKSVETPNILPGALAMELQGIPQRKANPIALQLKQAKGQTETRTASFHIPNSLTPTLLFAKPQIFPCPHNPAHVLAKLQGTALVPAFIICLQQVSFTRAENELQKANP